MIAAEPAGRAGRGEAAVRPFRLRRGIGAFRRPRWGLPRGQSLPEFALVLIPMMFLLLGAIQFGVIWSTQVGVTNAVRDAARVASLVQPKADAAGTINTATETVYGNSVKTNRLLAGLSSSVPFYSATNLQTATVCYTSFSDAAGNLALQATVTVTYKHAVFVPLIAGVFGSGSLAATSTISIPVGLTKPYTLPAAGTSGCSS